MSEVIDIKEPWEFRQLQFEDHRGMGYVSNADRVDILHTGAAELWQAENIAIGKLAAAAPYMASEMQRYLVLIERAESLPRIWNFLTEGTGIATANGYRAAIAKATT